MSQTPSVLLARHLNHLVGSELARELTDVGLVQRYVAQREEAAFAALLQRHGRLVWGVCRRVAAHEQEAEDVFQATFLLLARKAGSIRRADSIGSWLYGVAYRLATRARQRAARRRQHEQLAGARVPRLTESETSWRELQALLDEELQRLPEKLRAPFVLCCLEQKSKREAAEQLGWPEGTVSSRLAAARAALQRQLARRGVTLSALLCGLAVGPTALAVPPSALVRTTLHLAGAVAGGQAPVLTPAVLALVGAGRSGTTAAVGRAAVLLVLAFGFVAGVGPRSPAPEPPPAAQDAEPPRAQPADRADEPLPPGAIARLGTLRLRHADQVMAVAFAPDGRTLASAAQDGTIHLWQVPSGRRLGTFKGHEKSVSSLAFAPDGKSLFSLGWEGTIRRWDVATGAELRRWPIVGGWQFALSADGTTLAGLGAIAPAQTFHLWDVASGALVRELAMDGVQDGSKTVAFSPDGKRLASGGDKVVRVWDVTTGRQLYTVGGTQGQVHKLAFAPDGRTLAVGANDGAIRLWDAATGKEVRQWQGNDSWVIGLAFSPDGKSLFSAGIGNKLKLWDVATGKELRTIAGAHQGRVWCVAWSPDGKTLAAGSEGCSVQLWDAASGRPLAVSDGPQSWPSLAAFRDGGRHVLTIAHDMDARLWDVATARVVRRLPRAEDYCFCAQPSPDGRELALGCWQNLLLVDADTGRERLRFKAHDRQLFRAVFAPKGDVLATCAHLDRTIRLWDVATGRLLRQITTEHMNQPVVLTFAPDGRTLASGGEFDATVYLWDVATGRRLRGWEAHARREESVSRGVASIAFAPDGRTLATSGADQVIRLWDAATGRPRLEMSGSTRPVGRLAFTPDGRTLVSGSDAGAVLLWEVATGRERGRLAGHEGSVWTFGLSDDGRRLVSAGMDTTHVVWDLWATKEAAAAWTAEQGERLWDDLASTEAERAFLAMRVLSAAPRPAVALLKERLRPAALPDAARLARLLADLDGEQFAAREQATAELEKLGELAAPALRKVLEGQPAPETKRRVQQLLEKLTGALSVPESLRWVRAVELLEYIGGGDARAVLRGLALGAPEARLTREAKAALGR